METKENESEIEDKEKENEKENNKQKKTYKEPFNLYLSNNIPVSQSYFSTTSKCEFCDSHCSSCKIQNDENITIHEFYARQKIEREFIIHANFSLFKSNFRRFYFENLDIDDPIINCRGDISIYECLNQFQKESKIEKPKENDIDKVKDNDKDNGNKINNYSNITSSSKTKNTSSIKTNNNQNSNNKLKTTKIAPVAISKPPRPPTPPTEDLFKVDDEFGDFIPNTESNFANFDNFEAKASTTSMDDIISFDIQPNKQQQQQHPQQKQSIDDLFSTLTVDTSPIMPTPIATTTTIKQSSNIDDLFKNLSFSPQPPPQQQQQYQMPMSQTMPNIFHQHVNQQ